MVNLLANLLGPIFGSLGVSEADLLAYLTQLQGYVYFILAALVVLIVVLILASKAKKGFKHVIRWEAVMAFFAALLITVNVICYGPMYTNVSGFLNASKADLTEETIAQSKDMIKRIGEEGTVLLKNNGLLPLSSDVNSLNVFGWDSTNPLFGGKAPVPRMHPPQSVFCSLCRTQAMRQTKRLQSSTRIIATPVRQLRCPLRTGRCRNRRWTLIQMIS